jgi:phenylpyruvate tautomerase
MPYIKIETSKKLDEPAIEELLTKTTAFISTLLDKPEQYIMISINQGTPIMFSNNIGPAAYVELKSIGLNHNKCEEFSRNICGFIEKELEIPPDRVYIEFCALNGKMFGWNSRTF